MSVLKKASETVLSLHVSKLSQQGTFFPGTLRSLDRTSLGWKNYNDCFKVASRSVGTMPDEGSCVALNNLRDNPGATRQVRNGVSEEMLS